MFDVDQRERLISFIKKNSIFCVCACGVVVVLFGSVFLYQIYCRSQYQAWAVSYVQAENDISANHLDSALYKLTNLSKKAYDGYYVLSMMARVNITHQENLVHVMAQSDHIRDPLLKQWAQVIDSVQQINNANNFTALLPKIRFLIQKNAPFRSMMREALLNAALRTHNRKFITRYISSMMLDSDCPSAIQDNLVLLQKHFDES